MFGDDSTVRRWFQRFARDAVPGEMRAVRLNPARVAGGDLGARTLTNLYNELPAWLEHAHEQLDRAPYAAYGWDYPLEPEEVLARLVELNLKPWSYHASSGLTRVKPAGFAHRRPSWRWLRRRRPYRGRSECRRPRRR